MVVAAISCASPVSHAQHINIDFGLPGSGPAPTYAAAGLPGVWNSIEGTHTPFQNPEIIYNLVDLDGNPTAVTLYQFGGTELIVENDPSVTGDDAVLLNDANVTHTQNLETCLFINGLEDGEYEIITYAWRPNHPGVLGKVRHDFNPLNVIVGGAWPGRHVEGVTYARHIMQINNGYLGAHCGNVQGGNLEVGAALNGIQLRKIIAADFNSDGHVGPADLAQLLATWGQCARPPCPTDLTGDGQIGPADLAQLLSSWG
jgi:hypothetical protein